MRSFIGFAVLSVLCVACADRRDPDAGYYPLIDASSRGAMTPDAAGLPPPGLMGSLGSFVGVPVPTDGGGMCFRCGTGCLSCGGPCVCQGDGGRTSLQWDPPFDHTGPAGWKNSTIPLCAALDQISGLDVWSDDRGLFALVSGTGMPMSPPSEPLGDDAGMQMLPSPRADGGFYSVGYALRTDIWHNDGSGWKLSVDGPHVGGAFALSGMPRSSLLIHDPSPAPTDAGVMLPQAKMPQGIPLGVNTGAQIGCSLGVASGNALECFDVDPIQSVFAVRDHVAYAVMGGTRLLSYDGARWHGSAALIPYPVAALWADRDDVLAVGRAGTVLWLKQGVWTLQDPGTLEHFTSVWASASNDAWAGTQKGNIFHYDGQSWTNAGHLGGVTCNSTTPVSGIWGAGGSVYFHSDAEVARWDGKTLESLGNWSCSSGPAMSSLRITGLWGNSAEEVFVSLLDGSRQGNDGCGAALLAYFDGSAFHRI